MTTENQFTEEERACVNCRHFKRHWNPVAILDMIFDDGAEHYRCTLNGTSREFNDITGKVKIRTRDDSCYYQRHGRAGDCLNGANWEPNKRLLEGKTNLFKIINMAAQGKKES